MNNITYDFLICGAGPSSLALATYLISNNSKLKILIVDREDDIGGCHRTSFKGGLVTEHSPKVISSAYLNYKGILKTIGTSFDELYTPYGFDISTIGGKSISNLGIYPLSVLALLYLFLPSIYAKNISMKQVSSTFRDSSKDYINRLCLLTDGSDYTKYSLYQFLQLFNQQSLYKLYQPKVYNSLSLFAIWRKYLENHNVSFKLLSSVTQFDEVNNYVNVKLQYGEVYSCKKLILAIPPIHQASILQYKSPYNELTNKQFNDYVKYSNYSTYIPITFGWKKPIKLDNIWGFPSSSWGIIFIESSKYTTNNKNNWGTVISLSLSILDSPDSDGVTANSCGKEELIRRTISQFKDLFNVPTPDSAILNSNVYYEDNVWKNYETGFFTSNAYINYPSKYSKYKYVYNLGTQNGNSNYSFTSIESAVSNAMALYNDFSTEKLEILKPEEIYSTYIKKIIIVLVGLIAILIISKYKKN